MVGLGTLGGSNSYAYGLSAVVTTLGFFAFSVRKAIPAALFSSGEMALAIENIVIPIRITVIIKKT
jgi:hypothetical protein